jgi:hypothetical protein
MVDDYTDPAAMPEQDAGASEADAFQAELRKIREENGLEAPQGAPAEPPVGVSPLAQELDQSGFFQQQEAGHASQMERELQEAIRRSQAGATGGDAPQSGIARWLQTDPTEALTQGAPYSGVGPSDRFLNQDDLYEAGRFSGTVASRVPGGAISGVGSVLQAPDVAVFAAQHGEQATLVRQMEIADLIDRGETPFPPRAPGQFVPLDDSRAACV